MGRPKLNNYQFYTFVNVNNEIDINFVGSTANIASRWEYYKRNVNNPTTSKYNSRIMTTIREYGGINEFKMVLLGSKDNISLNDSYIIEEKYRQQIKIELHRRNSLMCEEIDKYLNIFK